MSEADPPFQFPQPNLHTQDAYTQAYSTAARTNPALTAVTMTTTVTGTASAGVAFGFNTAEQANRTFALINQLISTVNAVVVDVTANKQTLNAIIDDLQASNLAK